MKTKAKRIENVMETVFGVMFASVLILLVFGEIFTREENPSQVGTCQLFEADWERVFLDGTRENIQIPGTCETNRGETVRLETLLSDEQCATWLCMRASQQDMRVYVGDKLIQEYNTEDSRLFGSNSASAFVFFYISSEDAGKVLAIEVVSDSEYGGILNEVYAGDKYDIARTLIKDCSLVLLISFYMLVISATVVLIGVIMRVVYKKSLDITYLGLGILLLSLNMIAESNIRQFFLPGISIAEHVGYLLTMLIPYPFVRYINRVQKGRYEKIYRVLSACVLGNCILSTGLQIGGILDFTDTTPVAYLLIIVMAAIIAGTIFADAKQKKADDYKEVVVGCGVMIVVAVWESYLALVPQLPYYGGVALSFGLLIFLFVAGIKTARDMLKAEKEKQMALGKSEAKAQFLANMSHEIRTPINTIIGMNEMIQRENTDAAIAEYAGNVQYAGKMLLGLVNDILDFSKLEAGKMEIHQAEYSIKKLFTDAIQGIRLRTEKAKLEFETQLEEDLPAVLLGDELRLGQILNNLLSNAVKYTRQGKVVLSVKGIRAEERFFLCIEVKDTGIGIRPEDMEKLFDSFHRLEEDKNRYIEGTGLGLNITKQLVDLMGGSIEVKSEYGKGSCFTVRIPQIIIEEKNTGKPEKVGKPEKTDNRKRTDKQRENGLYAPGAEILAVDDNEMNLVVIQALLKRTGIVLTKAGSGRECIDLCRRKRYDLILMDHMMPEPDGIETLHMLRADAEGKNRDTKVIVVTANAIAGVAENYLEEGFADYIEKPVAAEDLEQKIRKNLPPLLLGGQEDTLFYMDRRAALEYCGNSEEVYREMVEAYCREGESHRQEFLSFYEKHDWKNLRITVHTIKSTSRLIGAIVFAKEAEKLELAAAEEKEEWLLAEGEKFLSRYDKILAYMEKCR